MGCEQPDVGYEEVGGPADVLVPVVVHDPVEARAGACGERERADNAGYDPCASDISLAKTREDR